MAHFMSYNRMVAMLNLRAFSNSPAGWFRRTPETIQSSTTQRPVKFQLRPVTNYYPCISHGFVLDGFNSGYINIEHGEILRSAFPRTHNVRLFCYAERQRFVICIEYVYCFAIKNPTG